MKALHFIYNGFSEYEVALACSLLCESGELHTASFNKEIVKGEGGFSLLADLDLNQVNAIDYDLFLVSGMMDIRPYWDKALIFEKIEEFNQNGKFLAAICGGPLFLAKAGALQGKRFTCGIPLEGREEIGVFEGCEFIDTNVVTDQNVITAKGFATVEFAVAIGDAFNLFSTEARAQFSKFWQGRQN